MAFSGYLIKLNGTTELPMKYIQTDSYKITPNQRMESSAKRKATGLLVRTTVSHTASKVEFNTPVVTNSELDALMTLLRNAWSSTAERKLSLSYYDPETNTYKSGTFYMPDIDYTMNHIDTVHNTIYYDPVRIAFIEY